MSRRATVGACCGCLAVSGVQRVINQTPGEVAGGEGKEDGSCANVTGHAVTSELGEEIVTAGDGVLKECELASRTNLTVAECWRGSSSNLRCTGYGASVTQTAACLLLPRLAKGRIHMMMMRTAGSRDG